MNALTKARDSIAELLDAMRRTSQARMATEARQRQQPAPAPRATTLYACGRVWQVLDADTGRLLAHRPSMHEAAELATRLELGLQLHH